MLTKFKAPLIGVLFAVATMPLHASVSNIDRLLDVSGFTGSIDAIPQAIELEMNADSLTAQVGDRQLAALIVDITKQSFSKSIFNEAVRSSLRASLTPVEISDALAWYETDTGQRIAAAHQVDQFAIQLRIKQGERPELNAKREAQIATLSRLAMARENTRRLTLDAATNMAYAMMNGLGMVVNKAEVRAMSESEIDLQLPKIMEEYHASLGFIYEGISDADMDGLLSKTAEPEVTIFYDAMWNGMSVAFDSAGTTMGLTLAAEIRGAM